MLHIIDDFLSLDEFNELDLQIEEKKDLFNRGHIFEQVKIDNSYPEYLQNNQNYLFLKI